MTQIIQFKDLLPAMASILGVEPRDMIAFQGRLRNLQAVGIPRGIVGRRGVPQNYTLEQAFEWLLAAELNWLGHARENAGAIIQAHWDGLWRAALLGRAHIFRPISALAHLSDTPHRRTNAMFVIQSGRLLRELIEATGMDMPSISEAA